MAGGLPCSFVPALPPPQLLQLVHVPPLLLQLPQLPAPITCNLPAVVACQAVSLPIVVSLAERPGPCLPRNMANGKPLPVSCFNPFDDGPRGHFKAVSKQVAECVQALLGLQDRRSESTILLIEYSSIVGPRFLDEEMRGGNFNGFIVHTSRDVLLAGLNPYLARKSFEQVAHEREASFVIEDVPLIAPLICGNATAAAGTFTHNDDFTAKFGYSCGQLSGLPTSPSAEFLARAIARGGPPMLQFANHSLGNSLGSTRAPLRMKLVQDAQEVSEDFRTWVAARRPRVTEAFRTQCNTIRAPFTLNDSLPLASEEDRLRVASWETAVRGVEEHLMVSIFGSLPNVTWARILAKVFERAETLMGEFDVERYRQWAAAQWNGSHGVGPGRLGCPWKGGASRILGKGAAGMKLYKPYHDDDNGVISLGCWTAMSEADTPTVISFLINGHEVILEASALRWVLFMGYIPHETRPKDPARPASSDSYRVHHSSFVKPDAEHLASQVLSNLPCKQAGGDWSMDKVHRLRQEAFSDQGMGGILSRSDALIDAL